MLFLNKVVIENGADSNLGGAVAVNFAKKSARLSLIGTDKDVLKKIAEDCEKVSKTKVFLAQINSNKDMKTAVGKTFQEYGRTDVIVNCMKTNKSSSILEENLMEKFDESMETNVKSILTSTHSAVKGLAKSKGVIINMLSCSANEDHPNLSNDVSKALVEHLTKHLALELAPKGIRVIAILPDGTPNLQTSSAPMLISSNETKGDYSQIPLKKPVKFEDVAELATFLASDEQESITGATYLIDSGAKLLR